MAEANEIALLEAMFNPQPAPRNTEFKEWFWQQLDNPDLPPPDIFSIEFDTQFGEDDKNFLKKVRKDDRISVKTKVWERETDATIAIINAICKVRSLARLEIYNVKRLKVIPSEIGTLTNLTLLKIWGCEKLTEIPESIGNLVNLTDLDIIQCTSLKRLPASISKLVNVTTLKIFMNSLESLPDTFGNLIPEAFSSLQTLYMGRNQLSILPDSFCLLPRLSTLGLEGPNQGVKLQTLPENFGNLSLLQDLSLKGNALTILPDSFGDLENLHFFNVSENELTTLPENFGNLPLYQLNISNNNISELSPSVGNPEETVLDDLNELTHFNMENNPIDETNPEIDERIHARIALRTAPPEEEGVPQPAGAGVAFEVHNAFNNINKQKLINFLKDPAHPVPVFDSNDDFIDYFDTTLREFLSLLPNNANKDNIMTDYNKILDERLGLINYHPQGETNYKPLIANVLEYVKRQSDDFKKRYGFSFTYDNAHAYEGEHPLSCAKGMIERFVTTLGNVAGQIKLADPDEFETKNYEQLLDIMEPKSLQQYVNMYISECFNSDEVNSQPTKAKKIEALEACVRSKLEEHFEGQTVPAAAEGFISVGVEQAGNMINNNASGGRRKTGKGRSKTGRAKTGRAKTGRAKTKRRNYRFRKTQKKNKK